ncbi:hypothetical protein FC65_GL001614 [Ligilactobacillus acidipiscis DSM 15836]|uniref:Holin n=1 Tax=Ligilactobacillus acidipiscis DSM 15836 TaxID=1423716 RepID=A0ABR5PML2_9LACO|nr:phage holin [Ligilactobacillus acidipiscis]KRM28712.1 hypothetical protein FC65_GL001614 [Ligilactobacillus acidipiscis DSM 15836]GAW63376.1 holin [Ligilactobacillus acidipiscis]GEN19585.1 hypothetical protein LAC02_28660 [Ligilactobacillus acidipiscis]
MKKFEIKKLFSILKDKDGSWNGKQIAGLLSLLVVLIQQIMTLFGINFPIDWQGIVNILNTLLVILGLLGVVTGDSKVIIPGEGDKSEKTTK